jgi:lipoate-protein ligase B
MNSLKIQDAGVLDYLSAWNLQNQIAATIALRQHPATLLLLEHPHTFTFGRKGQADHLLWDEAEQARRGITVHWVDRGGDVTYHGPGQLVAYPLLKLTNTDHVGYIRKLEQVILLALSRLGLTAELVTGLSGVWVSGKRAKPDKIAAIGVKVDANNITRHGFSLNVAPQMDYFDGILACGLRDCGAISLAELLPTTPAMSLVKQEVAQAFSVIFDFETSAQT